MAKRPVSPEDYENLRKKMMEKFVYSEEHKGLILANPRPPSFVHHNGYKMVCGGGARAQLEHRVIWLLVYGTWPDGVIDHINGDKLDNRIENLRLVDHATNARNRGASKRSKTGIAGVYRHDGGRFVVRLRVNGKSKTFGTFLNVEQAHERLLQVSRELYPDAQVRIDRIVRRAA